MIPFGEGGAAMDADRRERAKSIRAAREWLTGAEVALAGEDDLAGDLKLMLARAELARLAADRRARVRRWAGRLLPPLTAAAAITWIVWDAPPAEEFAASTPAQTSELHTDAPAPIETALPIQSVERSAAAVPVEEPNVQQETARSTSAEHQEEERTEAAQTYSIPMRAETAVPEHAAAAQPRVPNADMQHLMQVGGKILRE